VTPTALWVLAIGFVVAFANGANDVSKGIATLVGSGVTDYRRAIQWGALWTALGALAGAPVAGAIVTTFGKGFLSAGTQPTLAAAVATLVGAALWVLLANRVGLPVSTTHAIVGALVGVGAVGYGLDGVQWTHLGAKIALPLVATPFVALLLTKGGLALSRRAGLARGEDECLCWGGEPAEAALTADGAAVAAGPALRLTRGTARECAHARPQAASVTLSKLHWLTSGATCFARGVNDAPKIAALVLAASAVAPGSALAAPSAFGPWPPAWCSAASSAGTG
jgi:PiT family inorganic phosphate transporter